MYYNRGLYWNILDFRGLLLCVTTCAGAYIKTILVFQGLCIIVGACIKTFWSLGAYLLLFVIAGACIKTISSLGAYFSVLQQGSPSKPLGLLGLTSVYYNMWLVSWPFSFWVSYMDSSVFKIGLFPGLKIEERT